MRLNVWVPDELLDQVRAERPDLNVSAVLQRGLRSLGECEHEQLTCATCSLPLLARQVTEPALDGFFRSLMWRIQDLVYADGSIEGAARVAIDVARRHAIPSAALAQQPRAPRRNRKPGEVAEPWIGDLARLEASVAHHPAGGAPPPAEQAEAGELVPPPPRADGQPAAGVVSQRSQRRKSA